MADRGLVEVHQDLANAQEGTQWWEQLFEEWQQGSRWLESGLITLGSLFFLGQTLFQHPNEAVEYEYNEYQARRCLVP